MKINWIALITLIFGVVASGVAGVAAWYASESALFVAAVVCIPALLACASLVSLWSDRYIK